MLGSDARNDDFGRIKRQLQLCRRHFWQHIAQQHRRAGPAHQTDFAGNRQRRVRMVAGDHDDLDACGMAARHGGGHLGARRVFQPDQPAQNQRLLGWRFVAGQGLVSQRQHPQALPGHGFLGGEPLALGGCIECDHLTREQHLGTQRQHRFGRALAVKLPRRAGTFDHRHAAALGIKSDLG